MNSGSPGVPARVYGLDIMRAAAILTVVYLHGYEFVGNLVPVRLYGAIGVDGVNLFFVLSGYLIGGIVLKLLAAEQFGAAQACTFWWRRWLRTLPCYYLVLAVLYAATFLGLQPSPPYARAYIVFVQNLVTPHPGFFPEAWSLAIEEWFYLLLPAALMLSVGWVRREHRHRLLLGWTIAGIILATAYRAYLAPDHGFPDVASWDEWLRKVTLCRLDAIGYGVVGAWVRVRHPGLWQRHARPLFWAGLALLAFHQVQWWLAPSAFYFNWLALSLTPLAALMLLPALSGIRTGSGPICRWLTFVSLISYPMYLVNLSVLQLLHFHRLSDPVDAHLPAAAGAIARYFAYWFLTLGIATLIHRYFEQPIMDWRDRRVRPQAAALHAAV